jgi:adenosine/AMP kinase
MRGGGMEFECIEIEKPEEVNFILGQSHFIKTVEDIHEIMIQTVPGVLFGLAFCEASGPRLIRFSGTDNEMLELAKSNAMRIGAGHHFIIFLKNVFPINVLPGLRHVSEICRIFCATSNPTEVIIGKTALGRAILGVVDGQPPLDYEKEEDIEARIGLLRKIGYKLG